MPLPICPAPMIPTERIELSDGVAMSVALMLVARLRSAIRELFRELGVECRDELEEIADDAVIGDLEDRRFFVLVDRDDDFRILHAGQMLDRAGNADRDIEVGGDDLAGLADLIIIRHKARI